MKKVYLTLIVMMFATATVMAQAQVGIRAGLSVATINHEFSAPNLDLDQPWRTGFNVGIATQFRAGNAFSVAPELLYEQRGYRVLEVGGDNEATATFNYLSLPLMFRLHFGGILKGYINAGPTFSYWLGGRQSSTVPGLFNVEFNDESILFEADNDNPWAYNDARRLEIGAGVGGGIMLDTGGGSFLIDLRYVHGFTDLARLPGITDDINFRNRVVSVSLIYLVPSVRGVDTTRY